MSRMFRRSLLILIPLSDPIVEYRHVIFTKIPLQAMHIQRGKSLHLFYKRRDFILNPHLI